MIGGFIISFLVGMLIIIMGYQIHIKKRLFLIAGYQEETFVGDKEKLAKIFGVFSYVIGITTALLPFGLETIGDAAGIGYGIFVVISTIVLVIWGNVINKPSNSKEQTKTRW
ncbi:DUF3784 domain-containing protein [Bacillus pseudomycoides]|uniref:DUF3784 domain-containing protein n=1 Tax=Bacillus pseudomycoides TaxID=64104 RepID=UPI000BEB3AAE|nr:DUF3784 domain-containing protein [Bacillus pseudomycoides]PEE41359.1 DUF3784 domain-containing protein [Bacillus pseudomycoides]PEI93840.1 DUF3784 domain-containing protein [Bacillus pseudomycoides]PGA93111.1 DUF3784 domain-containing protein [Bacillus pseudomycoides]PHF47746.1 DUF3784 domain-containing protein [Bacillus pseudomycoides]